MKQNLLKTIAIGLLAMVGVNAWADDYDGTSPVYSPTTATNYSTLKDAVTAFGSSEETTFEIDLYSDVTIDARIEVTSAKTLNIVPKAAVKITRKDLGRSSIWFLTKSNSNATINIGSADYTLTIAGAGHADNQRLFNTIFCREQGNMTVTNTVIQNIKFDTENTNKGYLYSDKNNGGTFTMTDVTVKNCVTTEEAFIKSIRDANDVIVLQNTIDFEDCTGTTFDLIRRIKVGKTANTDKFTTNTAPLTIKWEGTGDYAMKVNLVVVVNSVAGQAAMFDITEGTYGLKHNGNTDIKTVQAYALNVTDAGAATLVLPFEATIPSGLSGKVYKLEYTNGDNVTATAESSTLGADKAVLVVADEGSYKFIRTSFDAVATGSGQTAAYGNMVGNYDANYVVPKNKYILTNHSGTVAFRKADGSTNKIQANRAYLDVTYTAGAPEFLTINFDGNVTAIDALDKKPAMEKGDIYNLQGVRMNGSNLPKGIYVKNGKKFIVK